MSLKDKIKATQNKGPLWKGPEVDGITQSMLGRFLVCKERFRVQYIEGLVPTEDRFNHRLEYGQMWHVCEEAVANKDDWKEKLTEYTNRLKFQYLMQQAEVVKWKNVCEKQFEVYLDYWKDKKTEATPLLTEYTFAHRYQLPSGRLILLRGKMDGVFKQTHTVGPPTVWLKENKTKSEINEMDIQRQLGFDLQTMMYLLVLHGEQKSMQDTTIKTRTSSVKNGIRTFWPIQGVMYNVIRRPLSGGSGSIRQHKPTKSNPAGESEADYYERLKGVIQEAPETFFARWESSVSLPMMLQFKQRFFIPLLEYVAYWYDEIVKGQLPLGHWQHPFGIYNPMDEGGYSDVDDYLLTGNRAGLKRQESLFGELT
jgi:hypothetical protein